MPYRLISSSIQKTSNPQKPNIEIEVLEKKLEKERLLDQKFQSEKVHHREQKIENVNT